MQHPIGFIHGRFQVLHKDHLKYLLAGKQLCDHLIVGITNPTPDTIDEEESNPERSEPINNPLTFEERKAMIVAAFNEVGIRDHEYSVVPFPICKPELLQETAPADAVYYLTIYDDWGREKEQRLKGLGLKTHVMWERPPSEKGISGTDVRQAIRDDRDWQSMIPPAVAELVMAWNLQKRLSSSNSSGS